MAMLGIFAMMLVGKFSARRFKIDFNNLIIVGLWAALGVFLGGHLLYALTNFDYIIYVFQHLNEINSPQILLGVLAAIFGGQVFYGGLIGGLISAMIYLKKTGKDVQLYAYIMAPLIPLFHAFGRIGCFLGGCCFGIEMEHGITFHDSPIPAANGVPRLPVQLIEAGCNFILFVVLYILQRKGKCKNTLLYIYLLSYSVIRFILEFFRGDKYRGFIGPLSTSQMISIGIFIFAVAVIAVKMRTARKSGRKLKSAKSVPGAKKLPKKLKIPKN